MEESLTREQVRAVDRIATERFAVPGLVLMENAGLLAALEIERELAGSPGPVAVVCGAGNNGGDGYVVARQLANRGVDVGLWATRPTAELSGDALANRRIVDAMGLSTVDLRRDGALASAGRAWSEAAVLVDALLGTGFQGAVRPALAAVVDALNEARRAGGPRVVALDLPSGLDADTGRPSNATVRADRTLTFVAPKVGFEGEGAAEWTGAVTVLPIGAPRAAVRLALGGEPS